MTDSACNNLLNLKLASQDNVDPRVASLASRVVESNRNRGTDGQDDDDALFAELEEEIENDGAAGMRETGLQAFKREYERIKDMKQNQHGQYTEITVEKEVVHITAREPKCVVHFYHTNFKRCGIMDKHLAKLAPKYFSTRFFRVFVENTPWLVEKLSIKVLPCVICFVNGVTKDRLVGFEELGNNDVFDTATLELRLSMSGVIQKTVGPQMQSLFKVSSRPTGDAPESDGDYDLDD